MLAYLNYLPRRAVPRSFRFSCFFISLVQVSRRRVGFPFAPFLQSAVGISHQLGVEQSRTRITLTSPLGTVVGCSRPGRLLLRDIIENKGVLILWARLELFAGDLDSSDGCCFDGLLGCDFFKLLQHICICMSLSLEIYVELGIPNVDGGSLKRCGSSGRARMLAFWLLIEHIFRFHNITRGFWLDGRSPQVRGALGK